MLFKPNFCCSCGEKIERAEWSLLTSRRFCDVCASEHQKYDWMPRAIVGLGVLLGIFGFGVWIGGPEQQQIVPLSSTLPGPLRKIEVGAEQKNGIKKGDGTEAAVSAIDVTPAAPAPAAPISGSDHPPTENGPAWQPAYYCGAMTKKGTPCSRRVKAKGTRCWQHAGKPSALASQSVPDVY